MTIKRIENRLKKHGLRISVDLPSGDIFVKGKPGYFTSHNALAQSRWFKNL